MPSQPLMTVPKNDDYRIQEEIGLAEREMFGAELAIPWGSFVYKVELSSSKTSENIRFDDGLTNTDDSENGPLRDPPYQTIF